MPRNGSGVMSKPPNTTAQPNTTILSAMFNSVIDDIIADLNNPRPITSGGTGASSVEGARAALGLDQKFIITSKNAAYTADASNNNGLIIVTATATIALTSAGTLGSGWHTMVAAKGGVATIDPSGTQKINGALTLVLQDGQTAFIYCTAASGDEFSAIVFNSARRPFAEKSANYTIGLADDGGELVFTSAATAAFSPVATLGTAYRVRVRATNGDVVLDPDASEQINGATTLVLKSGQSADITCNGTLLRAAIFGDTLSGPQLQGFATGLTLATNATDAANDIDFGAGAATSDTSPFNLMQFSALTKRLDATFTAGNNGGMLDTGAVGNGTYYFFGIERSDTRATDYLASLSSTAPTMPANYDRKKLIGQVTRASAANLPPWSLISTGINGLASVAPSGTSVNSPAIPASAKRIHLVVNAVTFSGNSAPILRVQTASGIIATGYASSVGVMVTGGAATTVSSTGFQLEANAAATTGPWSGIVTLTRVGIGVNVWAVSGQIVNGTGGRVNVPSGIIALTEPLTGLTYTTTTGTPTMSGTSLNVLWEA